MKKYDVGFVVAGSIMTIIFLVVINFLTSTEQLWFIYPGYILLLLQFCLIFLLKKQIKLTSIIASIGIMLFLIIINWLNTPDVPWVLYPLAPLVIGPVLVWLGEATKTMSVAICGSGSIILYYVLLNLYLSPSYPWAIFPAFVVLWWPLMLYHFKRGSYFQLSVHGSLLLSLFFIVVNVISSNNIWTVYPIFAVLWWPLSMYYFWERKI